MFTRFKAWLVSDAGRRVGRTLVQVLGAVLVAFLLDWGIDGIVVVRDYVFGQGGIIVAATLAIAGLMNLRTPPEA